MAKQSPSLYSVSKTFIWFAIVSVLLTASLAGIVWTDYNREWKGWQKKFLRLKTQQTAAELAGAEGRVDRKRLDELVAEEKAAREKIGAQADSLRSLQTELDAFETRIARAKAAYQDRKQFQDSYRYFFEEYRVEGDSRAEEYGRKLAAIEPEVTRLKDELDEVEKGRDGVQARIAGLQTQEKTARKEIDKLLEERTRIERRLQTVRPSLVKDVLNAPMVDFIAPTLEVQQIVLEDLQDDYHFAKVQKVDRCVTCHLGIDQKGFENAPQPFRTHPNLDLYLGSSSPHPAEKFGCTTCHGGNGHSVSFKDAAHTPRDPAQAAKWKKEHAWAELAKWDHKMLPGDHIEASCAKCHHGTVEVPKADRLNRGRKLAETLGCFSCHKVKGFEDRWKVGPDLTRIDSKVDADWVAKWIEDPQRFRPSTRMPRLLNLSNTSSPEDLERNQAVARSIAAYLSKHSQPAVLSAPPAAGDPVRGEQLARTVGCTGCHAVAGVSINDHGPELSGLGSKMNEKWLYTWLKDPKHVSPDTRMPSLRLSDQEAADITAYLLTLKNPEFEAAPAPQAKPEVVDEMVLTNLQSTLRRSEAEAELAKMSAGDRLLYLGKRSIAHQGCFACHNIDGFKDAKPIGTELSNEGAKDLHQFDFGFVHGLEHTRQDWIAQKLREPRIFDQGKVRSYYEKLRMPQFNLSEEEIGELTTFILSLTDEQTPLQMQSVPDLREIRTERGRLLISKLNCNGCHTFDGKPGALREKAEDPGAAPPILEGEGAKVQERWLHEFLKSPTTIRPWLTYRMPTFDLTDDEVETLVHTFANLAGEEISYHGQESPKPSPERAAIGKDLLGQLQCVKCHQVNASSAAMGASFLAPDLTLTKHRLKPDWVRNWIADPQTLEAGTMMPTFFPEGSSPLPDVLGGDASQQIEVLRDYLYVYQGDTSAKADPVQQDPAQ